MQLSKQIKYITAMKYYFNQRITNSSGLHTTIIEVSYQMRNNVGHFQNTACKEVLYSL